MRENVHIPSASCPGGRVRSKHVRLHLFVDALKDESDRLWKLARAPRKRKRGPFGVLSRVKYWASGWS